MPQPYWKVRKSHRKIAMFASPPRNACIHTKNFCNSRIHTSFSWNSCKSDFLGNRGNFWTKSGKYWGDLYSKFGWKGKFMYSCKKTRQIHAFMQYRKSQFSRSHKLGLGHIYKLCSCHFQPQNVSQSVDRHLKSLEKCALNIGGRAVLKSS